MSVFLTYIVLFRKREIVVDEKEGYTFICPFRHNSGLVFRSVIPVYCINPHTSLRNDCLIGIFVPTRDLSASSMSLLLCTPTEVKGSPRMQEIEVRSPVRADLNYNSSTVKRSTTVVSVTCPRR